MFLYKILKENQLIFFLCTFFVGGSGHTTTVFTSKIMGEPRFLSSFTNIGIPYIFTKFLLEYCSHSSSRIFNSFTFIISLRYFHPITLQTCSTSFFCSHNATVKSFIWSWRDLSNSWLYTLYLRSHVEYIRINHTSEFWKIKFTATIYHESKTWWMEWIFTYIGIFLKKYKSSDWN